MTYFNVLALSLIAVTTFTAARTSIAVVDVTAGTGVVDSDAAGISEALRADIINLQRFDVVERTRMNEVLGEQGLSVSGVTDISNGVLVGKLTGAKAIVMGNISKAGSGYVLNLRLVDIELGTIIGRYSIEDSTLVGVLNRTGEAAEGVMGAFLLTGKIIDVRETGYYANIGASDGVREGDELDVKRIIKKYRNSDGTVAYIDFEILGTGKVTDVYTESCQFKGKEGCYVKGDIVYIK
jgi:TolB-like protein